MAFQIAGCSDAAVENNKLESNPLILELNALATQPNANELIARLASIDDPTQFMTALDWQKQQFISGNGGARTAYMYAYNLYRVGIKDTSAFAYISGALQARIDGSRCKDTTGVFQNIGKWEQKMSPAKEFFISLDEATQQKFLNTALNREEKIKSRAPDEWVCSGGIEYFSKFHEKYKDNPNPPVKSIDDPDNIGKTKVYDDPTIKPEFVVQEEWERRRARIRENFSDQIMARKGS